MNTTLCDVDLEIDGSNLHVLNSTLERSFLKLYSFNQCTKVLLSRSTFFSNHSERNSVCGYFVKVGGFWSTVKVEQSHFSVGHLACVSGLEIVNGSIGNIVLQSCQADNLNIFLHSTQVTIIGLHMQNTTITNTWQVLNLPQASLTLVIFDQCQVLFTGQQSGEEDFILEGNSQKQCSVILSVSGAFVNLINTTFKSNRFQGQHCSARLITIEGGTVVVHSSTFEQNIVEQPLDIALMQVTKSNMLFSGVNFVRNTGGCIGLEDTTATFLNSYFAENIAKKTNLPCKGPVHEDRKHGGIFFANRSFLTLENCNFTRNSAEFAGVMFASKSMIKMLNCQTSYNAAHCLGGALVLTDYCTIDIRGSAFVGNTAKSGGVIFARDQTRIDVYSTEFNQNKAIPDDISSSLSGWNSVLRRLEELCVVNQNYGNGGVFCLESHVELQIHNSQFVNNTAASGGVLHAKTHVNVGMQLSSFNHNYAQNCSTFFIWQNVRYMFCSGGVVHICGNSNISIRNSTFLKNQGAYGGVISATINVIVHLENLMFNDHGPVDCGLILAFNDIQITVLVFLCQQQCNFWRCFIC